ncbi:MAG: hypothetical protein JKY95_19985 [Planctomycetaceae bacterium]|nr:hypothetical protein [Planctomycetaceae bacterium]
MNIYYSAEELTWRCSDYGEHVDSVIEHVNAGNAVTYSKTQVDTAMTFLAMIDDDSDEASAIFSRMIPANIHDAKVIDDKIKELAEEAARSYKGQYNG